MRKGIAELTGLTILTYKAIVFKTITGDKFTFDGFVDNILINIGGIKNYTFFIIVNEADYNILLSMPFILESQMAFEYKGNNMYIRFLNAERTSTGRTVVAGDALNFKRDLGNA